jgi:copper chaperone NosL
VTNKIKKMKSKYYNPLAGIIILLLTISCKIEPQAIEYGKDQCSFCVMNIVDKTHAAQYVTKKGKQFKFDAIECLVNELKSKDEQVLAFINVANYANPGEMIPALKASYVISTAIKSPMGMNLSAFKEEKAALEVLQNHDGVVYTWEILKQHISAN